MPQKAVYEVTTDKGTYQVEVEAPDQAQVQAPGEGISLKNLANTVGDWLPAIGGTVGGTLGGLGGTAFGLGFGGFSGAVGGATLGGAAGKAGQTLIRSLTGALRTTAPTPISAMLQSAGDIGLEGAASGAAEALGAGAGKLLGGGAKLLYRKALRPSIAERLAPRAAQTIETGLAEKINPFSPRSMGRIEPTIQDLTQQAESIIASPRGTGAGSHSPLFSPQHIAQQVQRVPQKFAGAGAAPEDRAAAAGVITDFLKDTEKVTQVPVQKQIATGILDAQGNPITRTITSLQPKTVQAPLSGPELLAARRSMGASAGAKSFGITRGAETEARKELYHVAGQELGRRFPEAAPLMSRTSRLIDLKQAAQAANERAANSQIYSLRHLLPLAAGGYGARSEIFGESPQYVPALRRIAAAELILNPRVQARAALLAAFAARHPTAIGALPRFGWNAATLPED